jgi:hypothetical protein
MTAFRPYLPLVVIPGAEPGIGLFALHPLLVVGTRPVVDGDGGVSIAVVTDHAQGVLFVIDPWFAMLEGDTVDVFLEMDNVYHHVVTAADVDQRLFFYVEAGRFVPGWIEQCYFLLHRKGEVAPDDPSVALRLRVKLDRPAGPDKEPHKPGHSELKIVQLPEEVIRQGVDAEWAAKGVPMTILRYPNIALRDTIQVKWGSVLLKPFVLSQAHVDGTEPIVIRAEQADILAAGDSTALLIEYEVYDEVWNYSEKWSIPTTVNVDAGAWRLEAPIIKESINGIIDLKALNQQRVTVQIHVRTEDFDIGDTITMTWIGTPQIGKPLINTQSREITTVPSILELFIPYEEVRAIAMGAADVSYVLTKKNGGPTLSSKRTFTDVIGDVYAHPAPILVEAVGDILEPDTLMASANVSYPGMADGNFIELIWEGTRSNGTPYLHSEKHTVSRNDAERKLVTFYITEEHINILANGRLDLWYRVSNDKAAVYGVGESEHSLYRVQAIPATLPLPKVPEAPEGVLDPLKIFDKVTVLVDYLGTVKDDILTYYWTSPNPFASTSDWLPITTVSAGKPVPFRVDARFVTANIGHYVKVRYTLKHAATGLYSYSGTLNLLIGYLVGELPPPEVIQAPDTLLDPMKALAGVDIKASYESMDPALDIISLQWLGTPGPGTSEDQERPGDASKTVMFHLVPSFVGPNINRMVSVSYGVKRYGNVSPSDVLSLRVLGFQDPETQLPRPEVPQAVAGVLDLMEFPDPPDVIVQKWPFIALGQRVWLRFEGKTIAGADHRIVLLDGVLATAGQVSNGLKEILARTELLKLAHASAATVLCKVAFDGASKEFATVEFPLRRLTVRTRYDYVTPVITQVQDTRGNVDNGGKTRDDEVTVTGTATRGETIELFDAQSVSMGTALVGDNSVWSRKIGRLTERTYVIAAKALYDADPVSSQPWTFTVDFAVTPSIRSVTDSKGRVEPGATTYDNSVLVEGDASAGERVQLKDGTTPIITLDVDNQGIWRHRINSLTVKTYNLIAQALYDVSPVNSPPYPFVAAQAVTPTISTVTDAKGSVGNGETTYYRTVTLGGKASKDEEIELRDGTNPLTKVRVGPDGNWSWVLSNLTLKSYSLTAKGLYGSEPISTPPRTFTVADPFTPSITLVTDSKGTVAPNGITYDNAVTVSGQATPREQVQLYNNNAPISSPVSVATNRQWSIRITGLTVRTHSVFARALYTVSPVDSQPRGFTVAAHIAPTITSVRDAIGEVPNGGQTKSTTVSLQGSVTEGHQVQIFDHGVGKHTVTATGTTWNTTLAVALGGHKITARAVTTGQVSNDRNFTVISPIPPLAINTAHVSLSGWIFRSDHTPTTPPTGSFVDRTASGGVPPYQYTSSNPAAAEVNISTGRVISKGNGRAVITVRDSANQTASYSVSASNVYRIFGTGAFNTYTQCHNAAVRQGGRIPSLAEWRSYINTYGGQQTDRAWCWAADGAGFGKRWAIYPATGQTQALRDFGFGGDTANGFGIR